MFSPKAELENDKIKELLGSQLLSAQVCSSPCCGQPFPSGAMTGSGRKPKASHPLFLRPYSVTSSHKIDGDYCWLRPTLTQDLAQHLKYS